MPRVEIPLIGPSYTSREKPLSAQTAKNMWPEINPEARNQVCLHNAAGTRIFATLEGKDRGMCDFNNLMYAVNGQTLYSIDAEGASIALGTIDGLNRCVMANDSSQLIITTGATPYRYTVAGGVEAITDPDLTNPNSVAYINNQFVFDNNSGTWGEWVSSSIEEGLAVDALDFANAEAHPDDILRVFSFRQLVYFFGSHSIEPWQNTGTGNPPFSRINSGVQQIGIAGTHAIVATSDYMYFLDNRRTPRRSNGLNFLPIGNPALGVEFAKYSKIDDCIAFEFVQDNQQFVAFTFPTADRTWCFHEPSGSWFQLEYISTGAMNVPSPIIEPPNVPAYIGPDIVDQNFTDGIAISTIAAGALFTGDDLVFTLGGTWPGGISINSSTGDITGTPTEDGTFAGLFVVATNINGSANSATFTATIAVAIYDPGMMTFDGATGYYNYATGFTGNKVTGVVRINRAAFTGGGIEYIVRSNGSTFDIRLGIFINSSDHASTTRRSKVVVITQNAAGTNICRLFSTNVVCDGTDHFIWYSFDGDAGTAVFYVDGVDADDASNPERIAPTTGTLETSSGELSFGASNGANLYGGTAGYFGYDDQYLTNPTDFYHPTNGLQELDESGWTEWGAQPLFWNEYGTMDDNKGSGGNMTANGTITGPA